MSTTLAPPPADATASPPPADHTWPRIAAAAVGIALVIGLVLLASGFPAAKAEPHHLRIGLVAPPPAAAQITGALDQRAPDAFALTQYSDEAALTEAIRDREVYGGLVLGAGRPLVLTATAGSTVVAQTLSTMAAGLSPDGAGAEVRDVVPL